MAKRRRKSGAASSSHKTGSSQRIMQILGIVMAFSMMLALIVPSMGGTRRNSPTSTPIPEPTETPIIEPTPTDAPSPTPSASLPLLPANGS